MKARRNHIVFVPAVHPLTVNVCAPGEPKGGQIEQCTVRQECQPEFQLKRSNPDPNWLRD